MSILVIDDAALADIKRITGYAKDHPYPAEEGECIGIADDPNHATTLGNFHVTFSHTILHGVVLRHVTIKLVRVADPKSPFAGPLAAFVICEAFGFTGWSIDDGERPPRDWICQAHFDGETHFIIIAQPMTISPLETRQ